MAKTIVGMFQTRGEAEQVAHDLERLVPDPREIQVLDARDLDEHPARHESREGGGFWSWLFGDVSEDPEERYYNEGMDRGDVLVMVTTDDERANLVQDLMEKSGLADDVEQREARDDGDIGRETATPRTESTEQVLPVVEEQMKIGKRATRHGVRAYTHVTERPVEEQIRLREERVRVERRPVDRPITADARADLGRDAVEVTETVEEPVVAKEARVVEEVVIGKDVRERTETVRDTVRRSDVEVERTGGDRESAPASRYGESLAGRGAPGDTWADVESEARRGWEEQSPGTWERSKDAIRHAWESACSRRRAA